MKSFIFLTYKIIDEEKCYEYDSTNKKYALCRILNFNYNIRIFF